MDHPDQTKRPDLVSINKKKRAWDREDFTAPANQREKVKEGRKERRKKAWQRPGPCQRTEKAVEHKGGSDTDSNWST